MLDSLDRTHRSGVGIVCSMSIVVDVDSCMRCIRVVDRCRNDCVYSQRIYFNIILCSHLRDCTGRNRKIRILQRERSVFKSFHEVR